MIYIKVISCKINHFPFSGLTKMMREALKESKHCSDRERLHYLKRVYFTHREVCVSESVYRLFRGLYLKGSDLKTIFVSNDLPQDRSSFLRRADGSDSENDEPDGFEEKQHGHYFNVVGRKGKFTKAMSIHDKYSIRPYPELKNICLAQFATTYEPVQKPKNEEFNGNISVSQSKFTVYHTNEKLPLYIKLENASYMRARGKQSVLRQHKSKNKDGHSQAYSELVMFYKWKNEDQLFPTNSKKCISLYNKHLSEIQFNKTKMYPFSETLNEIQEALEEMENENAHEFMKDTLDSTFEQENLNDELNMDPLDKSELPLEQDELHQKSDGFKFKPITRLPDEELRSSVRGFSFEQKIAFEKIYENCKKIVMSTSKFAVGILPSRIICHGKI